MMKNINEKYKCGWCPLCNQGWIIIVKDIQTSNLYLRCAECDTEWINPYKLVKENCLQFNTFGKYALPTEKEIADIGWLNFATKYE